MREGPFGYRSSRGVALETSVIARGACFDLLCEMEGPSADMRTCFAPVLSVEWNLGFHIGYTLGFRQKKLTGCDMTVGVLRRQCNGTQPMNGRPIFPSGGV